VLLVGLLQFENRPKIGLNLQHLAACGAFEGQVMATAALLAVGCQRLAVFLRYHHGHIVHICAAVLRHEGMGMSSEGLQGRIAKLQRVAASRLTMIVQLHQLLQQHEACAGPATYPPQLGSGPNLQLCVTTRAILASHRQAHDVHTTAIPSISSHCPFYAVTRNVC
jgi:hypothetical protein